MRIKKMHCKTISIRRAAYGALNPVTAEVAEKIEQLVEGMKEMTIGCDQELKVTRRGERY